MAARLGSGGARPDSTRATHLACNKEQGHQQKRITTRSWGCCWEDPTLPYPSLPYPTLSCTAGSMCMHIHTHDSGRTVAGLSLRFCACMGACDEAAGAAADNTGARWDAPAAQTACCAAT